MDKVALKPTESNAQYRSTYATVALDLITEAVSLSKNVLKHLSKFGLNLAGLRLDGPTFADVNLNFGIPQLGVSGQVRLDRLEINFWKLGEVGAEVANQILLSCWTALHETEPNIELVTHHVSLNAFTQIQDASYRQVIERYVSIPAALSEKVDAGVAFYLSADPSSGLQDLKLIVDRLIGQERSLLIKMNAQFDAKLVPVGKLAEQVNDCMIKHLDHLGLSLLQEGQQT